MDKASNSRRIARSAVRHEIARAALTRFSEQGFERTTVEDIAGDVGISARTYFRYFASKDEVLLEPTATFKAKFLSCFSGLLASHSLWESLELALQETALRCAPQVSDQSSFDIQAFVRQTPALLARQLTLMESLQLEAAGIYCASVSGKVGHDDATVEATVRCAFACLQAIENHLPKGRQDDAAGPALTLLMDRMMPCVLAWDQRS